MYQWRILDGREGRASLPSESKLNQWQIWKWARGKCAPPLSVQLFSFSCSIDKGYTNYRFSPLLGTPGSATVYLENALPVGPERPVNSFTLIRIYIVA